MLKGVQVLNEKVKDQFDYNFTKFVSLGDPGTQHIFDEMNLHRGDLVIQFMNPDHILHASEFRTITYPEKNKVLEKLILNIDLNDLREKIDNQIFKRAFNKVFKLLTTYFTEEEEDQIRQLK